MLNFCEGPPHLDDLHLLSPSPTGTRENSTKAKQKQNHKKLAEGAFLCIVKEIILKALYKILKTCSVIIPNSRGRTIFINPIKIVLTNFTGNEM